MLVSEYKTRSFLKLKPEKWKKPKTMGNHKKMQDPDQNRKFHKKQDELRAFDRKKKGPKKQNNRCNRTQHFSSEAISLAHFIFPVTHYTQPPDVFPSPSLYSKPTLRQPPRRRPSQAPNPTSHNPTFPMPSL